MEIKSIYDVVLAGPPCQPWSRANPEAAWFDDDRAEVFYTMRETDEWGKRSEQRS